MQPKFDYRKQTPTSLYPFFKPYSKNGLTPACWSLQTNLTTLAKKPNPQTKRYGNCRRNPPVDPEWKN